jgi:integrase
MFPVVHEALKEQAARQADQRMNTGDDWQDSDLVFTTRTGRPIEPRNMVRSFDRICAGKGIRKIRMHRMRHTCASLLKQLGIPVRDAMEILGHSRAAVTLEVYSHASSEGRRDALSRLDKLLGS